MQSEAQECLWPSDTRRGKEEPFCSASGDSVALPALTLASGTVRQHIFAVISYLVHVLCFASPGNITFALPSGSRAGHMWPVLQRIPQVLTLLAQGMPRSFPIRADEGFEVRA